jgi:transcriptional regulator PpsR
MNKHSAPLGPDAFSDPEALPGVLSASVAARLLAAVGDVTLILDREGVVLDLAVSNSELARYGLTAWVGQPFEAMLTVESKPKVAEMLVGVRRSEPARWRQVNHITGAGDLPMRYLVVGLGDSGRVAAIGRDLRAEAVMQQRLIQAQQSLERDYLKLRQAETRYRLLFDLADQAVLIVDAATRRVREANPAAYRMLGLRTGALNEAAASGIVDPSDRDALVAHLGAVEATDDVPPVTLRLRSGAVVRVGARLFRQSRVALLLLRVDPIEGQPVARSDPDAGLSAVVERMPDAFVLTDESFNVLTANAAFIELAEAASLERVRGQTLATWFGRPGIDLELVAGQLREHGSVRNIATILRGSAGGQEEIEVSAVAAPGDSGLCHGFTIRNVGRRLRSVPDTGRDLPRSVEQLTELVGRMSLKDIVRESTDLIERLCIEAALAYTSDNRASAAEILGLSRQSLYSKLHRHGLGDLAGGE